MNYRDIFLTLVYVILLIIMFSYIALILSSGVGDMKLSWAFYGFAMVTSIICVLSVLRSGRKNLVYWGMSSATVIMTILLVASIILSKPTESAKIQVIAYVMLILIVAINGLSLYLLTQKSKMVEIPVESARKLNLINKDNELLESLTPVSSSESSQKQQNQIQQNQLQQNQLQQNQNPSLSESEFPSNLPPGQPEPQFQQRPPGPQFQQRPPGPPFEQGPPGPPFEQGPPGPPFEQGPPGPPFEQGPPGPQFEQGPPGPPFEQGPPGPQFQQGPPGPQFQQGPPGPQFQQGPPGPQFQQGQPGTPFQQRPLGPQFQQGQQRQQRQQGGLSNKNFIQPGPILN
jgi:hypothetical protein